MNQGNIVGRLGSIKRLIEVSDYQFKGRFIIMVLVFFQF